MSAVPAVVSAQIPAAVVSGARVAVGLSGGVDSAVAAMLLQRAGARVSAVFMRNWRDDDEAAACHDKADFHSAAAVADALGMDLEVADFAQEYRERVFTPFLESLQAGDTPNPDVLCNAEIKFDAFRIFAEKNGADFVATGHYARVQRATAPENVALLKGEDSAKDQSYFLHRLTRAQLTRALFPAGRNDEGGCPPLGAGRRTAKLEPQGQHGHLLHRRAPVPRISSALHPADSGDDD